MTTMCSTLRTRKRKIVAPGQYLGFKNCEGAYVGVRSLRWRMLEILPAGNLVREGGGSGSISGCFYATFFTISGVRGFATTPD